MNSNILLMAIIPINNVLLDVIIIGTLNKETFLTVYKTAFHGTVFLTKPAGPIFCSIQKTNNKKPTESDSESKLLSLR